MDQDVLKYGDLIILHGCLPANFQNASPEKRRKSFFFQNDAGFLSGLGFTDNRVFLQNIPSERANPLASVADLPNHKQLIFQVWPKLPCEAHKRMRKFKKERKLMSDLSDDDAKENADDIYAKLNSRVTEECKSHQRVLGQVIGNHVPYGNEVQFMHYYSKSFLKADVTCSNLDKSAYKFELSHEFSSRMAFRIRPKYSVRQEGEPIQFGDEILIYSSKLDCYVNFSLNYPIEIDREVRIPARLPSITKPFEHAKLIKGCKRYEAHISQFKHCTWRMYFYGSAQVDESNTVRGGDLVLLKHSQDDIEAYLTADDCLKSQTPEAYGRVYNGEFEEERDCINAIWEVETDNYQDRHAPVEVIDQHKKSKSLRLRHLLTGKVLVYDTVELDGRKWIIPALSKEYNPQFGAAITFHPFMTNPKKELYYGTAYSMSFRMDQEHEELIEGRSVQSSKNESDDEQEDSNDKQQPKRKERGREYRFVSMRTDKDYTGMPEVSIANSAQPSPPISVEDTTRVFKPLREYEFATRKKLIIAESLDSSAEHAFLIIKLDQQQESDIAFIASNIPILTHFRDLLKSCTDVSQIPWDVIPRVIAALRSLIFFTHKVDPKQAYEHDALSFEGPTNVFRQKLLKDFRMIEILTEILYYPFYLGLFTLQKIHDNNFKIIFQHCYILLGHTIDEYRPNELYASQWLELYMRQALAPDSVDIKAEETLTGLIDNNKRILDSKINSETIRQFVESLKATKNQKSVNLLQALIVCDGKAVLKNQTEASRLIFEHEEVKESLILKMRMRAVQVQIDFKEYNEDREAHWITLSDFYSLSQQKDNGERYEYFLSLIYLFANLCLERNYIAIEGLQSVYTYEICYNIISGDYQLWDLKAAFARLMNNLWIDRKPYHPLHLPRHIILWEDIPASQLTELPAAIEKNDMFENLMEYLQEYFSNLAQEGSTKIYETERNRFTLVVLELAKTLATFGFYSTVQKLKGLAQSLLVMLNGMMDAMTRAEYEEFSHNLRRQSDISPLKVSSNADFSMRTSTRTRSASPRKGTTRMGTVLMNKTESTFVLENSRRDPTLKYKETEETVIVMDCKNKVCELIKIIMTITNDINVMKFLSSFKNSVDFTSQSPLSPSPNRSMHQKSLIPFIDPNRIRLSNIVDDAFQRQVIELKKICEQDSLDMSKLAPTSFMKILYNLLRYEHKDLISNAFEILCLSNAKQFRLKNTLDQIRLIESEDKRKGVKDIAEKIRSLEDLAETSETWYISKQTFSFDNKFEKFIQLVKHLGQYLVFQTETAKGPGENQEEEEIIGFEEAMDRYEAETDFEIGTIIGINYEYQQMLRHLKAEQPLLELLKYEHSDNGSGRSESQMRLLSEIIKFLTKFTYREKVIQGLLTEHITLFFKLLKRYPGIGIEGLISELFRNNLKLLQRTKDVEKFVKYITGLFTGKDMGNYRNSRLIHSMEVLMTYKGKAIKANQVIVMSALTVQQNAQLFFGFLTDSKKKELKAKLQDFDRRIENNTLKGGLVELPADLDLIISLIHVIARSADGKNAVTESKAQSLFTIDDLNFLYEASRHCWHLKYAVLSLFNHAYGDTEREIKEEINKTNYLIRAMVNDMEYLTRKPLRYKITFHQGRIESEVIQELVYFRGLIPCIDEILSKKLYKNIPDHLELFTRVLDLLLMMNRKGLTKSIQRRRIRVSIDMFKIHAREIFNSLSKASQPVVGSPISLSLQDIDNEAQDTFTPLIKDENTRTHHLKRIVKKLSDREDYKLNVEEEFENAVFALKNIEKSVESDPFSSFLPFAETVKSLLYVIDIEEDIVDKDLKITGLRMFRRIIEAENKSQHTTAAEWDTDMWIKYERRIVGQQNLLAELGLVETLCKMISMSNDMDLQFESVLVSIALLLGGNLNVQKAFLEYMQNDSDNAFLQSLKDLIVRNFDNVKKVLSERNKYFLKKTHFVVEHEKIMYARKDVAKKIIEAGLLDEKDSEQSLLESEEEEDYMEEVSQSFVLLQRVYRFLQLLCEGHNLELQSHLLAQKNENGFLNRKSFDFISHTAFYFNVLVKQVNIDSLDLIVQILEFLIEAVQGPCEENQKALIKANIVNSCMDFMTTFRKRADYMRRGFFSEDEMNEMDEASVKSMKLMNALIEGGISSDILSEMDSLELEFLIDKLSAFYLNFVKQLKKNPETDALSDILMNLSNDAFDQKALESFDVYIFLANIADHSPKAYSLLYDTNNYDLLTQKALEFFKASTAHIEILFKDKLIKTYFPLYPVCHYLTADTKDDFMQTVNRTSPNDKIVGLVNVTADLFDEMEHLTELNSKIFTVSTKRYNYLRDFSTILSFVMNLMFLGTAYYRIEDDVSVRYDRNIGALPIGTAFQILGWCQLITSALMIVFWTIINGPVLAKRKWRDQVEKNAFTEEEEVRLTQLLEQRELGELPLKTVINLLWRKGPYDPIFHKNGKLDFGHPYVWLVWLYKNTLFILSEGIFIFIIFYFVVSVLGYTVSEIMYCLHLLDVINRFDTLRNVIRAVTYNFKQLLLTAFLGLILIYIYSLVGFVFLDDSYFDDNVGERTCTSMLQCYMTTINWGLRAGGGIGDILQVPSYEQGTRTHYVVRFFFDVTFFAIINIVFLNIIFGIIIDTFAEMRDDKKVIDEDMQGKCYICNIERFTLDKDGGGFKHHIREDHYVWNYVYYIYSVQAKDPTEYNGIESYVKEKLEDKNTTWFPMERALVFEPNESK